MAQRGTVRWFNNVKGYGFIEYGADEEIFVHFTGINKDGYRSLNKGQIVEFKALEGPRGLQATDVVVVSDKEVE